MIFALTLQVRTIRVNGSFQGFKTLPGGRRAQIRYL